MMLGMLAAGDPLQGTISQRKLNNVLCLCVGVVAAGLNREEFKRISLCAVASYS